LIQVGDEIRSVAGSIDIAEISSGKIHALLHAFRLTQRFARVKERDRDCTRRNDPDQDALSATRSYNDRAM
jgi:hypothetical protein